MPKFEHKILEVMLPKYIIRSIDGKGTNTKLELVPYLAEKGLQGWEIKSSLSYIFSNMTIFLQRQISE